jgi:hypothetical protein
VIKPPSDSLSKTVDDALKPQAPTGAPASPGGGPINSFPPAAPPSYTNDVGTALTTVGKGAAAQVGGPIAMYGAQLALSGPLAPLAGVLAVDLVAGAWDLGYVPWMLQQIGTVKAGGKF